MIVHLAPEEITDWFLAFHVKCANRLANRLIPGRFKHVRAFAFSHAARCWIFYDVGLPGTQIVLAPAGGEADRLTGQYVHEASVLKISRQPGRGNMLARTGFWCVPAMRHLLNIPGGALLPDGLWRDCLKADARIVIDGFLPAGSGPARSCDPAAAGASHG